MRHKAIKKTFAFSYTLLLYVVSVAEFIIFVNTIFYYVSIHIRARNASPWSRLNWQDKNTNIFIIKLITL